MFLELCITYFFEKLFDFGPKQQNIPSPLNMSFAAFWGPRSDALYGEEDGKGFAIRHIPFPLSLENPQKEEGKLWLDWAKQ